MTILDWLLVPISVARGVLSILLVIVFILLAREKMDY